MKQLNNKFLFFIILMNVGCSSKRITLNSKIHYKPILKVNLSDYESVQNRDTIYQNPKLALGIAIAGGGSRAQYYGIGVLLELESIKHNLDSKRTFLKEVDYYSSVSGGCYAAGYYLTIQKNILKNNIDFPEFYFKKGEKFQNFVWKSASKSNILWNRKNERGRKYSMAKRLDYEVLQYDSIDLNNKNKFHTQMKLSDFYVKNKAQPILPIFVPNGTIFNNGERIPFMPHIIHDLSINRSLAPNKGSIPLNKDTVNDGYNFPLTYAITASSAFPGVLPNTKFGIKGTNKILCVIDGGAVDNLGFTTLLELLNEDTLTLKNNKKALIIDCSGEGQIERFSPDKRIRLGSLINTAALYSVTTKYLYHEESILNQMQGYGIPVSNSLVLGFSTIRAHLQSISKNSQYDSLVNALERTKDINKEWFKHYSSFRTKMLKKFLGSFEVDSLGDTILSSISSNQFEKFEPSDILIMYEYSSQVSTKLKIYADEMEMLILAGRYTVYLEKERLKALLELKE